MIFNLFKHCQWSSRVIFDSEPHHLFYVRNRTELHSSSGESAISLSLSFAVSIRMKFTTSVYLIWYIFADVPSIEGSTCFRQFPTSRFWFLISVIVAAPTSCISLILLRRFEFLDHVIFCFHRWNAISLMLNSPNENSLCRIWQEHVILYERW